jgi:nucleolar protein 53
VLTSDELTGSLRQLKPCFTVAKDRFKALQKRGLLEPRVPKARRRGRKVAYEHGARTEKALEGQAEVEEMRRKRIAAERVARGKQHLG